MPRMLNPEAGMDAENAAVLAGAPRARSNVRTNDARGSRNRRKARDKFHVPQDLIPNGWVVEWKRESCLGMFEEADYQMDLQEAGWKFADPKVYHTLVPEGYTEKVVRRGGMVLMTRPSHMKKEAQRLDREEAVGQVRDKLTEIGMTGSGELPRRVQAFNRDFDRPAGRMVPEDDGEDAPVYEGDDNRPR